MGQARSSLARVGIAAALASAGLAALSGCRGDRSNDPPRQFFPDMDDSPKVKPQTQSYFFEDGRSMRMPVEGTLPFGRHSEASAGDARATALLERERADLLRASDALYRGVNPDGSYVERIPMRELLGLAPDEPIPADRVRALIALGEKKFDIYCIVCHGASGDGDGMVGARWASPIPSYHQPVYYPGGDKGQDGYIFHVIRNGVPNPPGVQPPLRMPSYAENVSERQAWAIVSFIRSLQQTRMSGGMSDWTGEAQPTNAAPPAGASNAGGAGASGEDSP